MSITSSGIERVKSAVLPFESSIGRKAATVVPVAVPSGTASSRTPPIAARWAGSPRSSRNCTASAITIALSTSMPRPITRAAIEIWWRMPPEAA